MGSGAAGVSGLTGASYPHFSSHITEGGGMSVPIRVLALAALALLLIVPSGSGAPDIDRSAVDFKTPAEIKWVRNAAGTNEQAVLFGDPGKTGPDVVRLQWLPGNMSRPHFHPNDRFFVVISGTWWMGTGEKIDPDSTVPAQRPVRRQVVAGPRLEPTTCVF